MTYQIRNPMTNDERNPKSEGRRHRATRALFGFRPSGFLRISSTLRSTATEDGSFVIRHCPAVSMKTPKTKLQTPKKLQISSSNSAVSLRHLGFGAWNFSGAWCLGFGVGSSGQSKARNREYE